MEITDIKRIENELGIRLPDHFISFLLKFRGFSESEINPENFVYMDTDRLIKMNQLVGFYSDDKIVKRKLLIGDNGGGDFYLIDLENFNNKRVYVFDHEESVENNYNTETGVWDWNGFEYYDDLENYKDDIANLFRSQ